MNKLIRSCYRDSEDKQFELEIMGETDTEYLVRLLPKWQKEFQEGNKIHPLRKYLIDGELYKFIEYKPHYEQLRLFDL